MFENLLSFSSNILVLIDELKYLLILVAVIVFLIAIAFARYIGKKADEEGYSYGLWCFLGLFFGLAAFISLCTGLYAEKRKHSFNRWATLGFFFGLIPFIALVIGTEAERYSHSFRFWSILGVLNPVSAVIILNTGLIAEKKNFSFVGFAWIGAVFGLIGLFVACFLPNKYDDVPKEIKFIYNGTTGKEDSFVLQSSCDLDKGSAWKCAYCGHINDSISANCSKCFEKKPR